MNLQQAVLVPLGLAMLALVACTSGSAVVTGTARTAIAPEQVTVYSEPPPAFEVIGRVRASSSGGWTDQDAVDKAIKELRKQAALLGANGVLLDSTDDQAPPAPGTYGRGLVYAIPEAAERVEGTAIYVNAE